MFEILRFGLCFFGRFFFKDPWEVNPHQLGEEFLIFFPTILSKSKKMTVNILYASKQRPYLIENLYSQKRPQPHFLENGNVLQFCWTLFEAFV